MNCEHFVLWFSSWQFIEELVCSEMVSRGQATPIVLWQVFNGYVSMKGLQVRAMKLKLWATEPNSTSHVCSVLTLSLSFCLRNGRIMLNTRLKYHA